MPISVMTPSRGRVSLLLHMMHSAINTATAPLEFIIFADDDDAATQQAVINNGAKLVTGPRSIIHSARWDKCLPLATGDILFHANDDIVWQTEGWDRMVEDAFSACPDRILMVHGDDLAFGRDSSAAHPIVHRRWVETLGYFIPPYFDGDYGDTWVTDLANRIGRRKFLPFVCEHLHYLVNKGDLDLTMQERLDRQSRTNLTALYDSKADERARDAEKLRALLGTPYANEIV